MTGDGSLGPVGQLAITVPKAKACWPWKASTLSLVV